MLANKKVLIKKPIYIFSNVVRKEEKLILTSLENLGEEVKIVLSRENFNLSQADDLNPKLILIRCLSSSVALERARLFEAMGINTINNARSIEICSNKSLQALLFKQNKIKHPKTFIAYSIDEIQKIGNTFKTSFLIKPINGSWGRGIAKIQDQNSLDCWISGRESVDPQEKQFPILVQEYIEKPNYDVRVVIVGSKPIVAFKRVSDLWKTNTHLGAEVQRIDIDWSILSFTKSICNLLGDGIYGLDLMKDKNNGEMYVCEINANPEFSESSKIHGVNVADEIAKYIIKKLGSLYE